MKQNILLNSFQGIYYHALRFYVTTMWTSHMSHACPGSDRNAAVSARCFLSGIKNLTLVTVVKGFAVGWALWLLLTFCCHARNCETVLHIPERFPSEPWWEWQLAGVCQAEISANWNCASLLSSQVMSRVRGHASLSCETGEFGKYGFSSKVHCRFDEWHNLCISCPTVIENLSFLAFKHHAGMQDEVPVHLWGRGCFRQIQNTQGTDWLPWAGHQLPQHHLLPPCHHLCCSQRSCRVSWMQRSWFGEERDQEWSLQQQEQLPAPSVSSSRSKTTTKQGRAFGSTSHPRPPWDRAHPLPLFLLPCRYEMAAAKVQETVGLLWGHPQSFHPSPGRSHCKPTWPLIHLLNCP